MPNTNKMLKKAKKEKQKVKHIHMRAKLKKEKERKKHLEINARVKQIIMDDDI